MIAIKLSFKSAAVLALGVVAAGAVAIVHQALATPVQENPVPAARKDLHGDPLPEGALARLGTSRLRTTRYVAFAPDGRRVALSRAGGGLEIFEIATGKPLAVIRAKDIAGREYIVGSTIAFTPDGRFLAAVCWQGGCGIWETATGRLVRSIESGRFYSIARCNFSPDGKLLAVGTGAPAGAPPLEGHEVGVYDVESGRQLFTTPGTNSVFSPDGQFLVMWNGYGIGPPVEARRVSVPKGKVLTTFRYSEQFRDFAPRSDGKWFLEITGDNAVQARDVTTGEVRHTFRGPEGDRRDLMFVRHVPGRRELLVAASRPAAIWCWDLDAGTPLWDSRLAGPVRRVELSADGKTLATSDDSGAVRVWDAASGKERVSFRPETISHGKWIDISPDGKVIATHSGGAFSSAVAFWDATTGKLLSDLPGHVSGITAAAFAPDGTLVNTAGKDGTLRTWDVATGRERSRFPESVAHLAVAADGKTLWVGQSDGLIRILNAETGKEEGQIAAFRKALIGLALSADGKQLIVAGRHGEAENDYLVQAWDVVTRVKLREFGGADAKLEQLAIRLDGGAVATTHFGQRVKLWNAGGKQQAELVGQSKRVNNVTGAKVPYRIGAVALSPDGRWLAYADQEQGIALVDARTGGETARVKLDVSHQNPSVRDELREVLAFSPDSKTLAWSGVESTAEVFLIEVASGQVLRKLPGDSHPVRQLLFSPDGTKLLSAGPDGSALIWEIVNR